MFRIEIDHGGAFVNADDLQRAHDAARAAAERVGITTPEQARAAYADYMAKADTDGDIHGLPWHAVDSAASVALTEGWHNTEGAYCHVEPA